MIPSRKAWIFGLILGLIGVVATLSPYGYALEEGIGLHLLFQLRGAQPPPEDVVVVALDRQSSKQLDLPMEPRNWPRTVHARLIDRLHDAGAAVIVFDLIFNEPQTPETDAALEQAMARAGNVILAQSIVDETIKVADPQGATTANVNIEKMVPPIQPLADAALAQAPFPVPRVPVKLSRYWTFKPGSGDVPTMPVVAFCAFSSDAFYALSTLVGQVRTEAKRHSGLLPSDASQADLVLAIRAMRDLFQSETQLGPMAMHVLQQSGDADNPGEMTRRMASLIWLNQSDNNHYLNFYGPAGTIRTVPYFRMISDKTGADRPQDLQGKAVFVGQTESYWPKAKDGFFTVYAREGAVDISGVEIAATAFANLIEGKRVEPLGVPVQMAIVFMWGIAVALFSYQLPAGAAAAAGFFLSIVYLFGALVRFKMAGAWFPVVMPLFFMWPAGFFTTLVWKYRTVSRERRTIRQAFGYYLPNQVVDQLARNIDAIHEERQAVYSICLFTDAEKYTNLSESMDPESLTALMNRYYEAIFKPIRDNGGVVLQVIGDSVLSLWTASRPDPALKSKACKAALAVAEAVERFNQDDDNPSLPTRIGMHAGDVVLGNIGAMDHFEYRPVGDIVNTASRLEGLNKYLGTRILTSDAVVGEMERMNNRFVGRFVFKGKTRPVKVYELAPHDEADERQRTLTWRHFGEGLQAFEQQAWDRAGDAFEKACGRNGGDGPSAFYLRLCHRYRQTPPGSDWDGTVRLHRK